MRVGIHPKTVAVNVHRGVASCRELDVTGATVEQVCGVGITEAVGGKRGTIGCAMERIAAGIVGVPGKWIMTDKAGGWYLGS
jgi:hypothetical protein